MNSRILMFASLAAGLAMAQNTQNTQQDRSNSTTRDSNSSATGRGGHPGTGSLSGSERNFLMKAAEGGRMEVELGQRAASQGSNDQVKSFGQRMVDDHTKANQRLEQLASSKGITLDKSKSSSGKASQMMNMSGEQFDRAYMRHMVSDHQKDVSEFEKMSNSAKDPEETLPTLREHLQQARTINQSLGSMSGHSSNSGHDSNSSSGSTSRSTDSSNSGGNTNRRDNNTNQTNPNK
jgi:putative membrane protein